MRRLCLGGFVLLAVSSCKATTAVPTDGLDAIRVGVQVQPTTVMVGSTAQVTLTLRNVSPRSVVVSGCPIYFWVQDVVGQVVGGSKLLYCLTATLVYTPLVFKPLETKTITYSWVPGETQNVPPGVYDVFGWVNDPAHRSAAARITVQPAN